ncbi:MAG: hypothetical protein HY897_12875 [Deltaproteobacteria bacterium]|nr:hypothetical protein [Deltaproteobacteria bacterium]
MRLFVSETCVLVVSIAAIVSCSDGGETGPDAGSGPDQGAPSDTGTTPVGDAGTDAQSGGDYTEPDGGGDAFAYPDAAIIFEVREPARSVSDDPYQEEFPDQFRTTDRLATLDVRALAYVGGATWAGTADGLFRREDGGGAFTRVDLHLDPPVSPETIVDISRGAYGNDGLVAVALSDRVMLFSPAGEAKFDFPLSEGPVTSVAAGGDTLVAGTAQTIFKWTGATWEAAGNALPLDVRDLAVTAGGEIIAATGAGVLVFDAQDLSGPNASRTAASGDLLDDDARAVTACGGRTVVATARGIAVHDGQTVALRRAQPDGLPTDNPFSIDCNDNGVLIGHAIGATWLSADFSHTDHYVSPRWLPDNRVPAVALGADNDRWAGTSMGASRIHPVTRTLAEKERAMSALVPHFWRMDGVSGGFFSSDGSTPDPYSPPSELIHHDHDNDGLWTQMMIGGWCYAYALTGDEQYYENARLALYNMFLLIDVPASVFEAAGLGRGFIARSLVRSDEGAIYNDKLSEAEEIGDKGILRWHPVHFNGHDYLYKGDTSSDETTGHFFGFPVFYDLCAKTEEEKAEVAEHAGAVADYVLRNGFFLLDLDGTKTTWGHWAPEYLAVAVDGLDKCIDAGDPIERCFEAYYGGGWLNSLEILGMMLAAFHMTGETKFYDAYETLISEHRYDEVAMPHEETFTITNPSVANHSDHELAMLAYTTLIRYEPNPDRRARWLESLKFLYDWERPERNPCWTAVYALSGGTDPEVADAVRTLREMPDDRREWRIDNFHRKDAIRKADDRHKNPQYDRVFPYDELRTFWWNGNPYSVVGGGSGNGWSAPTAWLLPYYMLRWAGAIKD